MGPTPQEMLVNLTRCRRAAVKRRADEFIAEELSLQELRKALSLTQQEVAKRLAKGQAVVSRFEQRGDLRLSTLREYVRSLGGELELVARFDKRTAVRIRPGSTMAKRAACQQASNIDQGPASKFD